MNFNQYDREYLQEIVKESASLSEVLRKLNKSIGGNNIKLKISKNYISLKLY